MKTRVFHDVIKGGRRGTREHGIPVSSEAAGRFRRSGYSLSRLHGGASKRGEAEAEQLFERRRLFHLSAASPAAREN